jgi:precorrin-4/cobalt-precorrin-4 C11-methyltransferase
MNLDQVSSQLQPLYGADCPVIVVFRASWPDECILRGTISTIQSIVKGSGVNSHALILVGKSLGDSLFDESYLYSAARDRVNTPEN